MKKGFALLWVVVLLAFLGIIATGLFFEVNTEQMISRNYKTRELSFWAAEGGREWGKVCFEMKYPHPKVSWFPGPLIIQPALYNLHSMKLKGWRMVGSINVLPSYELVFKKGDLVVKDNGEKVDVYVYEDGSSESFGMFISFFPPSIYFYLRFDLVIFAEGKFGKSKSIERAVYDVEYRYTIL